MRSSPHNQLEKCTESSEMLRWCVKVIWCSCSRFLARIQLKVLFLWPPHTKDILFLVLLTELHHVTAWQTLQWSLFCIQQLRCSEGRIVTTRNFMPWSLALKRVPIHTACHCNFSSLLLLKNIYLFLLELLVFRNKHQLYQWFRMRTVCCLLCPLMAYDDVILFTG